MCDGFITKKHSRGIGCAFLMMVGREIQPLCTVSFVGIRTSTSWSVRSVSIGTETINVLSGCGAGGRRGKRLSVSTANGSVGLTATPWRRL